MTALYKTLKISSAYFIPVFLKSPFSQCDLPAEEKKVETCEQHSKNC